MAERTREKSEIERLIDKYWKGFLLILVIGAVGSMASTVYYGRPITWQRTVKEAFDLLEALLILGAVEIGLRLSIQWSEFFDDWKTRRSPEL